MDAKPEVARSAASLIKPYHVVEWVTSHADTWSPAYTSRSPPRLPAPIVDDHVLSLASSVPTRSGRRRRSDRRSR
jgi:hypothetical protein